MTAAQPGPRRKTPEPRVRVFILDSAPLFRQGMRLALAASLDLEVLGDDGLEEEVIPRMEAVAPDVVLMGMRANAPRCLELARRLRRRCPGTALIMLVPSADDAQLFAALQAGAAACVSQEVSPQELTSLVRQCARGAYPINEAVLQRPGIASRLLEKFAAPTEPVATAGLEELIAPLSTREKEVLSYIAEGYSNKEIAATLSVSDQTIKHHVRSILRKLDANDRTQAVVRALRGGWLPRSPQEQHLETERGRR